MLFLTPIILYFNIIFIDDDKCVFFFLQIFENNEDKRAWFESHFQNDFLYFYFHSKWKKPYLFIFLYLIETTKIYFLFVLHVERHSLRIHMQLRFVLNT